MKSEISRDSFKEEKDYSGVYQQQGRMLTDADWNEMVRILKHRMDRTAGAAIESGSPREGGILHTKKNVVVDGSEKEKELTYKEFVANPKFQWGRLYIDGAYGELRRINPSLEVGLVPNMVSHNWKNVQLQLELKASPVILSAMQTCFGGDTATVRLQKQSDKSFKIKVEEEQSADDDTSHVEERVGYIAFIPGNLLDRDGRVVGEVGRVESRQDQRVQWHKHKSTNNYTNPIVIMELMSYRGSQPAHIRLKNVNPDSFEYRIEEWNYLDGVHATEEIGYIVLEQGQHNLNDGTTIEAGAIITDHNWLTVPYTKPYSSKPVVLSQCQTHNGEDAVITRQKEITSSGVDVRLQEEERGGAHVTETVGYIAAGVNNNVGPLSIEELICYQRDYPANPWPTLEFGQNYQIYADLWERLVVALEDNQLTDPALHGADTCVRTKTMVQIKLAKETDVLDRVQPKGTATISVDIDSIDQANEPYINTNGVNDPGISLNANTLFRIEVHSISHVNDDTYLTLKWSKENGAEERPNVQPIDGFLKPNYIYECFSSETEMHLGEHLLENQNGWEPLKSKLYSLPDYLDELDIPESKAVKMPRIRRWDGFTSLKHNNVTNIWSVVESSYQNVEVQGNSTSQQTFKLQQHAGKHQYAVRLTLGSESAREFFISGDYWLVMFRGDGNQLNGDVLSEKPVGIHHHYTKLGLLKVDSAGSFNYEIEKPIWRRLSFPSLSDLSFDRVLTTNREGEEVSIEDLLIKEAFEPKSGIVEFKGQLEPNSIFESKWIAPPFGNNPYLLIVGIDEDEGVIMYGYNSCPNESVLGIFGEINKSNHKMRIRVCSGARKQERIRIKWWAIKAPNENVHMEHVTVYFNVEPPEAAINIGETIIFSANVTGLQSDEVEWSVRKLASDGREQEIFGGDVWHVDSEGKFHYAPFANATSSGTYRVYAKSLFNANMKSFCTLTVRVERGTLKGVVVPMRDIDYQMDGVTVKLYVGSLLKQTDTTELDDLEYIFSNLESGNYIIRVNHDGFQDYERQISISGGEEPVYHRIVLRPKFIPV